MAKRIFKVAEPEELVDPSIHGNYNVIYKQANGTPEYGNVRRVLAGDVVEYYDGGTRTGEVHEVVGRGEKMRVRTRPMKFQGLLIRPGEVVQLKDIRSVMRLRNDLKVVVDPNSMRREFIHVDPMEYVPPPPLPEVKFEPVVAPKSVSKPESDTPVVPKTPPKVVGSVKRGSERIETKSSLPPMVVPKFAPVVKPVKAPKSAAPVVKQVVKSAPPVVKLQVRETTYHDDEGFNVVGKVGNKSIRIFVRKRETAERIVDMYKSGSNFREINLVIKNERIAKSVRPSKPVRLCKPVSKKVFGAPAPVVPKAVKIKAPVPVVPTKAPKKIVGVEIGRAHV